MVTFNQSNLIDLKKHFLEDTKFVVQFTFLLSLILFLSLYLILQSFTIVNRIAVDGSSDKKIFQREIIANNSFLEDLDLSDIKIATKKVVKEKQPAPQLIEQEKLVINDIQEVRQEEIPVVEKAVEKVIEPKKPKFTIESNVVPSSVEYLKKRFYSTNSPVYSIMLAEKFFNMKMYKKAMKWAFVANELDSSNEVSWILYAKAKAKLNKKDEAINILLSYLKNHDSSKVQNLLNQLQQGV